MKPSLFAILLLQCYFCNAQLTAVKPDTLNIYKNKAGVRFSIYFKHWFSGYGIGNSFSWSPKRTNKQDSLVIEPHPPRYFRVYDNKSRLMFEGLCGVKGTEFEGDVKFYYKTGELKKIEHWDNRYYDTTCTKLHIPLNESPGPEGTWNYYRKNQTLKKQVNYFVEVKNCNPLNYCKVRQIKKFVGRRETSLRLKKLKCWSETK